MSNAWNEIINKTSGDKKEVNYLKFQNGATTIRLLDKEPYSRWTHWIDTANKGKGCSIDCLGKGCPVCDARNVAKSQGKKGTDLPFKTALSHSINVINRANGEVAILEKGNNMFQDIAQALTMLQAMDKDPDMTTIDIIITKSGGPHFSTIKYAVMPNPAKISVLTAEEQALDKYTLTELKPKLEPHQVIGLMNGLSLDEVCKKEEEVAKEETTEAPTNGFSQFNVDFTKQV